MFLRRRSNRGSLDFPFIGGKLGALFKMFIRTDGIVVPFCCEDKTELLTSSYWAVMRYRYDHHLESISLAIFLLTRHQHSS